MKRTSGRNPEYARRLKLREARQAEVETMLGWSATPARPMSKSQARRIAIRSKGRKNLR